WKDRGGLKAAQLLVDELPEFDVTRSDPVADGTVSDLACVVLSLTAFLCIATDTDVWLRPPALLLFVLFVPGWTLLRTYGGPASLLGYVGAIGLSTGMMLLLGE